MVRAGKSLSEALLVLADEPAVARSAAQDVAYGVLRRYGWGEFILGRLMSKPLTHPETQALLLGALYRLDTRPDSSPMVVDQAVAAAGELAGGVFQGCRQWRVAQFSASARVLAVGAGTRRRGELSISPLVAIAFASCVS